MATWLLPGGQFENRRQNKMGVVKAQPALFIGLLERVMQPTHAISGRSVKSLTTIAVALCLSTAALVVLPSSPPADAKATAVDSCSISPILVNSCRPWLGGVASGYPQAAGNSKAQDLYQEKRIGRQLDIVRSYYAPAASKLTSYDVSFAQRPNTMLEMMWNPTPTWVYRGAERDDRQHGREHQSP